MTADICDGAGWDCDTDPDLGCPTDEYEEAADYSDTTTPLASDECILDNDATADLYTDADTGCLKGAFIGAQIGSFTPIHRRIRLRHLPRLGRIRMKRKPAAVAAP
jgi:hypothetical protein